VIYDIPLAAACVYLVQKHGET